MTMGGDGPRDFLQRFRGGIWFVIGVVAFIVVAVMIS